MDCLDYTFRNNKAKISSSNNTTINIKNKNQPKLNEYIYDLENTITLNQEFISNFISVNDKLTQPQKNLLKQRIDKIKNYFNLKKNIHNEMNKLNGKILINKQIIEETRRRNEENYLYYKDQIIELTDNVNKKSSLVKQIQKKFNEVEIYIQRECKNPENINKYGHWSSFTIVPFMNKNESLIKRKAYFDLAKEQKNTKINMLLEENETLKKLRILQSRNNPLSYENYLIKIQSLIDKKERVKEQYNIILDIISDNSLNKEAIPPFYKMENFEDEKIESLPISLFDQNKNNTQNQNVNEKNEKKEVQELPPPEEEGNNHNSDKKEEAWNISDIEIQDN